MAGLYLQTLTNIAMKYEYAYRLSITEPPQKKKELQNDRGDKSYKCNQCTKGLVRFPN